MSRNAKLTKHLSTLQAYAHGARTQADIHAIANIIAQYTRVNTYKFNNTPAIIGLCLSLLGFVLYWWGVLNISNHQYFYLFLFNIAIAIACVAIIFARYKRIKTLSTLVYARAVAIKAGINRDYNYNPKLYYKELKQTFSLFTLGSEGQSISKKYVGNIDNIPFTLVEFRYIETSTRTTHNGTTTSSHKKRSTHYKYAVLVEFRAFNYLTVNTKRFNKKWDSTNSRFNKLFKIRCANEIATAKFFDPKTVLAFVDNYSFIKSLDVTSSGTACIEVPKEVCPSKVKSTSLRDHQQFIKDLKNPVSISLLEKTKELVQLINKQQ